jgi:uncharacterized protein YbaR (Trm112 family)
MDDHRFEFDADFACPVCKDPLDTVDDVYEHIRLHDLDVAELEELMSTDSL